MLTLHQFLKQIPKIELHYHLLGGLRYSTLVELTQKYHLDISKDELKGYYRKYSSPTRLMKGGIEALNFFYPLLREAEDYYRVAEEILEDLNASHIRYVEFFWNPSDTHLEYSQVTETLLTCFKLAELKYGIIARLIPSINREKSPEEAVKMVEQIIEFPYPEVIGIGIDYKEHQAPIENFWKAYRLAKQHGLRLTGHCSEFGLHWRNVETAIELIQLERIDHGYSITDNPTLMKKYAEMGIPFTVVPSNTYFLKKWPDKAEWRRNHPIKIMALNGLKIVPATDDWHIHNTNGFECYRVMVEELGFDLNGIRQLMLNSIDAAWISEVDKQQWRYHWAKKFDELRGHLIEEPIIAKEFYTQYGAR